MYNRLTRIDEFTRCDHTFLKLDDRCFCMGEYTARAGFAASDTNDLVINLKKPMDRRGRAEWKYKGWAIRTVAGNLRRILGQLGIEGTTFVPVPPSKAKTHQMYDDRLVQVLQKMSEGYDADVREMVLQRENMAAAHESDVRPSIDQLLANYCIDEALAQPPKNGNLVNFDDVLTTGAHFKAMQAILSAQFPEANIHGLFVARRAPNTDDVEGIL